MSPKAEVLRENPFRTESAVRAISSEDLELNTSEQPSKIFPDSLADDHPLLRKTNELISDGYAGILFTGPPGTGKSWYADRISRKLVDADEYPNRQRFVQFHHSYQYEDFVEGFVPIEGGFRLSPKHLLQMCKIAEVASPNLCVLVIDEISRTDPGRVFGEALTYIEVNKRERKFHLASGSEVSIPRNLIFLATMNPVDNGADQVDAAFERRFAKIAMDPSPEELQDLLSDNGMNVNLIQRVLNFFRFVLSQNNIQAHFGHAYFVTAKDEASLERLWSHQLKFHFRRAFQLYPEGFNQIEAAWKRALTSEPDGESSEPEESTNQ